MKKILITGVAGFVGHHAAEHFLKNTDWTVYGVDSFRHMGDPLRIQHLKSQFPDRFMVRTVDLAGPVGHRLADHFKDIDYVLNIASESHVERSIQDPVPFCLNNYALMLNVLEFCRQVNPVALIQCSTDEVFGPAIGSHKHREGEPHIPSNPYAASKSAQNSLCISYWRTYGVPLIITNCMNMIGERQDPEKFIPLAISKIANRENVEIHGTEEDIGSRHYIHSRNLADAWLHLLKHYEWTGVPKYNPSLLKTVQRPAEYNIVGEVELNNLEIAQLIASHIGQPLFHTFKDFHSARPGHDKRYALDGTLMDSIGWKPPLPFARSLENTINWTLKNREWMKGPYNEPARISG